MVWNMPVLVWVLWEADNKLKLDEQQIGGNSCEGIFKKQEKVGMESMWNTMQAWHLWTERSVEREFDRKSLKQQCI